ncbi:hypothetical protein [Aeromicrobium endophyticum]|uniref:hypothetical protein n=1 Tax=Aeromicrobium endophyticum TaxID=2292704 RepID=UPI0018F3AB94|nr:hypothetical protein [Aeromicrobium endophyticum]
MFWGNVNGAGEDNRNVGRMAVLLAGLPTSVPATSVNRLWGSLDVVIDSTAERSSRPASRRRATPLSAARTCGDP